MTETKQGAGASYRALRDKARAKEQTHVLHLKKTGATVVVRKVDLAPFLASGNLPMHLVAQAVEAMSDENGAEFEAASLEMTAKDQIKTLVFMRDVVQQSMVSPRIVVNPQTDDEISPEEMDWNDFVQVYEWNMGGGEQAAMLENFHGGPAEAPVAGTAPKRNKNARQRAA